MQRFWNYSRLAPTSADPAPGATFTVYEAGTLTLATIYSDTNDPPTPQANPGTADATSGYFKFYAPPGRYDVKLSGGGIVTPFTWGDITIGQDPQVLDAPPGVLVQEFEPRWAGDNPGAASGAPPADPATLSAFGRTISEAAVINLVNEYAESHTAADYSSTAKFGLYSLSLGAGKHLGIKLDRSYWSLQQGFVSFWIQSNIGLSTGVFELPMLTLATNGSAALVATFTEQTPASQTTKTTHTVTSTTTFNDGSPVWRHVLIAWSGVNVAGSGALTLYIDGVSQGTPVSGATLNANATEGIALVGRTRQTPSWTKFSAMSVVPQSESSNSWTLVQSGGPTAPSVNDGVLSMATTGTQVLLYERTNVGITTAAGWTYECKFKISNGTGQGTDALNNGQVIGRIQDDVHNLTMVADLDRIALFDGADLIGTLQIPCWEWNVVRVVKPAGVSSINLYVNNLPINTLSGNSNSNFALTSAGPLTPTIRFGDETTDAGENCNLQFEYVAYADTPVVNLPTSVAQARIDSLAIGNFTPTSDQILDLSVLSATEALSTSGVQPGPWVPWKQQAATSDPTQNSVNMVTIPQMVHWHPADGTTEFLYNISGVFVQDQGVGDYIPPAYAYGGDALAATTLSEKAFFTSIGGLEMSSIRLMPSGAVTANNANYATISVYRYDSVGGSKTLVAQVSTTVADTGNWVAFRTLDFGTLAVDGLLVNQGLTIEITKTGTGVQLPAFVLVADTRPANAGDAFIDMLLIMQNIGGWPPPDETERWTLQRGNIAQQVNISGGRTKIMPIGLCRIWWQWAVNAGSNQGTISAISRQRELNVTAQ